MKTANLVFPHQLFKDGPLNDSEDPFFLIEEDLFFDQYSFHKLKLAHHRASMKFYEGYLTDQGKKVHYVESINELSDVRKLIARLSHEGYKKIRCIDPTDEWLNRRIRKTAKREGLEIDWNENALFINTKKDLSGFFKKDKKKFYQTSFYKSERTRLGILIGDHGEPVGGKWTYDTENRKKYPRDKTPPAVPYPDTKSLYTQAVNYVSTHFKNNPGQLPESQIYPIDFDASEKWLTGFLNSRFAEFGPYEDAILQDETVLHHSVLTPVLNIGLLTPARIVEDVLNHAQKHEVPINTTEGFIRQIIGWREFIRGVYEVKGNEERTTNFWGFEKKMPSSFYDATTGIKPVDRTIQKVLDTGYCHHIERLMILGNFMLLCEIHPDEVYRWFMEMFIDAYDWVMVPNIYGMSQFADGGLMSTKPYISGSNYIKKMSDYENGSWQTTWDGLFWRFMHVHREFFKGNPRLSMLVRNLDRMSEEKLETHLEAAESFLKKLG